ncbi:cyclomaltodextrin glucanotransferase [Aestuariibacter halophilus]|uniref:Cyclomaltodextrin glucanotransferase n=1 Tax=Fluctibacter halophilus TaxID=226011 RepID=A0ABS8G4I3_9ALTE|nr:alpha-amylase family glycosyl hydrolase [Aestuariibacter halophilus]MCC2615021.1 cyclomaltodextrin glucanotransferase [Aestuariibacter halophilus]
MKIIKQTGVAGLLSLLVLGTHANTSHHRQEVAQDTPSFYGTLTPYASEAVYFLLTDRFVDGDPTNNHVEQGGQFPTFDRPLYGPQGQVANVGYLGGDFKGVLNNAQYIKDMGFTSVWLTPIYDNPDEAFSGGEPVSYGAYYKDGGKTGYHGYWGVNFFAVDEHLPSEGLQFADLTRRLRQEYDLKFVLDIVANHGSPAYSMPVDQPKFGEIYDQQGTLLADHQNIHPASLDSDDPLLTFYNTHTGLAQLSDINENNPAVLDYFEAAYLKWIEQGAHALRVDTIKEMPHFFWKKLFDRIRQKHPDIFIFGESYSYDADFIAEHTQPQNGGVSVLDFPGRKAITDVFENPQSDYADILSYLHLNDQTYANPYDLMTFYDNHDMPRMNASDNGFIDANNWLFTARGIPVIYYGSEINFMTGKAEHQGNRNYLGQGRIDRAPTHPIQQNLTRIAHIRKGSVALQRGLQVNLNVAGDTATFLRVYQHQGEYQTALVMLNKGDTPAHITVDALLDSGIWYDVIAQRERRIDVTEQAFQSLVPAHGVRVLLFDQPVSNSELLALLADQQRALTE